MTKSEAEGLLEAMNDHKDIFPKDHRLELIAGYGTIKRGGEHVIEPYKSTADARPNDEWGVGVYDPHRDMRVNLWDEAMVDQFMTNYRSFLVQARRKRGLRT